MCQYILYTVDGEMLNDCPRCAVGRTFEVIGGKWKAVILFYLLDGTLRFTELHRKIPAITQRMLTLALRELEADGLVERTVFAVVPPRVEYALTPFGRTLEPLLRGIRDWGTRHKRRVERAIDERERLTA